MIKSKKYFSYLRKKSLKDGFWNKTISSIDSSDVPPKYIVDIRDLKLRTWRNNEYTMWSESWLVVKEGLDKIQECAVWSTETFWYRGGEECNKCVFVKDYGNNVIPCYVIEENEMTKLIPIARLEHDYIDSSYKTFTKFPSRNVRFFFKKEDWEADDNKRKNTSISKSKKSHEAAVEASKTNDVFSFKTPKMKVVKILKSTDKANVSVGDTIYGEIPVFDRYDNGNLRGLLNGVGTCTNYVNLYCNDKLLNRMSPLLFQDLFTQNLVVEIL